MSAVAHFFVIVCGSNIHERVAHFFVDIYMLTYSILIVFCNRKALGTQDTLSLMSFGALPLLAIPLGAWWDVTPIYFTSTLSLILLCTVVHIRQGKKLQEKEQQLSQNRVAIMLSQIQPHFLYNALGSISQLCKETPIAQQAMVEFSEFLRGNMYS